MPPADRASCGGDSHPSLGPEAPTCWLPSWWPPRPGWASTRRAQAVIEGWQTGSRISLSNRLRLRHVITSAIARGRPAHRPAVLRAAAADPASRSTHGGEPRHRGGEGTAYGPPSSLSTSSWRCVPTGRALRGNREWRIATAPMAAVRPPATTRPAAMVARLRAAHAQRRGSLDAAPGLRAAIRDLERAVRMRDWSSRPSASSLCARASNHYVSGAQRLAADGSVAVSLFTHDGVIHALVIGDGRPRIEAGMPAARAEELGRR